jgi:peptidoglycan/LPS O-acetylase OafA/YrhL
MLGSLRFVLAIFVVLAHLGGMAGNVQFFMHWGAFAVFGFYLVSGYLMTRVLHETYSFRFGAFALNRFLRLFPIYYLVAIISAVAIFLLPSAGDFHAAWKVKLRVVDILGNGLIFPFEFYDASFRLLPATWSIAVELVNYFLLWLIVGRSLKMAAGTALLALAYHVASGYLGMSWASRYFPSYAAILPFTLGACVYFWSGSIARLPGYAIGAASSITALIWIANIIICGMVSGLGKLYYEYFFYLNFVSLLVLVALATHSSVGSWFPGIGKMLGDLAYPIFLVHWIVGFGVSLLLPIGAPHGLHLFVLSLPPILAVSWMLAWGADRWVEPLRNRVRARVVVSNTPQCIWGKAREFR